MTKKLRFLILGDVVGRPGREAVSRALPKLTKEYQPHSVIVNIENITHGRGLTDNTFKEVKKWEADVYSLGDHAWDSPRGFTVLEDKNTGVIRPANYPAGVPGRGYHVYTKGAFSVAVLNLQGQVFFKNHPLNPFYQLDELLAVPEISNADIRLVDFHAEATSEKRGLGWHADGRVAAVWGTHTHVPTNDAQIMPGGTGYITDVGMCGSYHSIIGSDIESPLKGFLTQMKIKQTYETAGPLELGGVLLDIDARAGKTTAIAPIRKILNN